MTDYEAAAHQMGLIDWVALQKRHPSSVEMPPYSWLKAESRAIVDAALGDIRTIDKECCYPLDPPRAQQKVWVHRYCKRPIRGDAHRCWQHKDRS